ncbi:MAG: Na(+)-translocating NADH-quinone reductase subunit A [Myxococcota bacterium]|nr:Na(+)-translocating NADH-quinone reductase subunit A [Myxococcota bacterium]
MGNHVITKGLDLPITGQPEQAVSNASSVTEVAVLGHDYPTMKPRMHTKVGDQVKRGQLLFEDRKSEGVHFTAPAAGEIVAIHRGDKRLFRSLVIKLSEAEKAGEFASEDQVQFESYNSKAPKELSGDEVRALLSESGLWTAIRVRPHGRVPGIKDTCHAVFVTAIDTNPLAPSIKSITEGKSEHLKAGLTVLKTLTEGSVFLCVDSSWNSSDGEVAGVQIETFNGPHPAGLPGTHIHMLAPVSRERHAFHLGVQDVIAIGELVTTGILNTSRVVSLAGPVVKSPRLIRTRLGASLRELTAGELAEGLESRIISGSVLYGHNSTDEACDYLNRYDQQISCIAEDRERVFLGWMSLGFKQFSTIRAFASKWLPKKNWAFTTNTNGSHRAMVPIGMYERLMPLDVMPTFLLRALLMKDLENAEKLGCLELHEEDLGLCSFVSPGKEDYGSALRGVLTDIWQEG